MEMTRKALYKRGGCSRGNPSRKPGGEYNKEQHRPGADNILPGISRTNKGIRHDLMRRRVDSCLRRGQQCTQNFFQISHASRADRKLIQFYRFATALVELPSIGNCEYILECSRSFCLHIQFFASSQSQSRNHGY
jgi:hypothetical protein